MERRSVMRSLPQAYEAVKSMDLGQGWESDYRVSARTALKEVLEGRMEERISEHLEVMGSMEGADRRNGTYIRHLLTELGDLELAVPRTRTMSAVEVVRAYARRVGQVDRMILSCFVLGLSTRKVAHALWRTTGRGCAVCCARGTHRTHRGRVVTSFQRGGFVRGHPPGRSLITGLTAIYITDMILVSFVRMTG